MPTENPGETKGNTKSVKVLTGLLCIMLPVGLVIMLTDFGKPYLWTTTIFLGLQALALFFVITRLSFPGFSAISAALIIFLSFAIEHVGLNGAYPFGNYVYATNLPPLFFGVPLAIPFAWYSVTISSLLVVKFFLPGVNSLVTAFVAAILVLASDILLEPFASFANVFWIWDNNTIPLINFISWFVIGFVFSFLTDKFTNWNNNITNKALFIAPIIIFSINILNFAIINLIYQYYLFVIAGLVLIWAEILFLNKFKINEA